MIKRRVYRSMLVLVTSCVAHRYYTDLKFQRGKFNFLCFLGKFLLFLEIRVINKSVWRPLDPPCRLCSEMLDPPCFLQSSFRVHGCSVSQCSVMSGISASILSIECRTDRRWDSWQLLSVLSSKKQRYGIRSTKSIVAKIDDRVVFQETTVETAVEDSPTNREFDENEFAKRYVQALTGGREERYKDLEDRNKFFWYRVNDFTGHLWKRWCVVVEDPLSLHIPFLAI